GHSDPSDEWTALTASRCELEHTVDHTEYYRRRTPPTTRSVDRSPAGSRGRCGRRLRGSVVAARAVERHRVDRRVADRGPRGGGMDDLAVAGVDAHVRGTAVKGADVAGLQIALGDRRPAADLCLAGAGNGDARLLVGPRGQAGAVERAGAGGAPGVRGPELGIRGVDDLLAGRDLGRGRRELDGIGDGLG